MKCWYFKFEGQFLDGSPEYGCKGVFSSCLVPVTVHRRAKAIFSQALKEQGIELIEILEHFEIDCEELDPEDEKNTFWIEWCKEAKTAGKALFDKYHVFDG